MPTVSPLDASSSLFGPRHSVGYEISIEEWNSVDRELPASAVVDLTRDAQAAVGVQLRPNGVARLTARSFVGRLRLGSVDILLKPKLPMPSVLTLLAEVHELTRLLPNFAGFRQTPEIVDLLIHVFLNQVDYLTQRGLKRTYVDCDEEIVPVRGRLDVRRTSALHMRAKPKVWCMFEEYSLDGAENRALLATLRAISSNTSMSQQRRRVAHKLTADFVGVADVKLHASQVESIVCDRLASHYEPALRLASLILASMGLANEFGGVKSSGFLVNMNELFERFVFRRLSALLSSQGITVRRQVTERFDKSSDSMIRPDLVIQAKSGRRMVADTKYKTGERPEAADLYQMLAYCRVMRINQGLLITAGDRRPRTYVVCDGQTTIDVLSVDLGGAITNIHKSMEVLAGWIRNQLEVERGGPSVRE